MLLSEHNQRAERPSAGRPMVERHSAPLMPLRDYVRKEDPEFTLISTELLSQLLGTALSPSVAKPLPPLRNRYFGLRHGQSEPNLTGVISSDPAVGTVEHGLTPLGRLQSRRVGTQLVDLVGRESLSDIFFYSSDFTRALETAQEASNAVANILAFEQGLQSDEELPPGLREGVRYTSLLRERFFGEIDGTSLMNYNHVWPRDLVSASHREFGVEPVEEVVGRVRQFMTEMEQTHKGQCIVLVSHADTLQIAQTYIAGTDPRTFSLYRFTNAEVRGSGWEGWEGRGVGVGGRGGEVRGGGWKGREGSCAGVGGRGGARGRVERAEGEVRGTGMTCPSSPVSERTSSSPLGLQVREFHQNTQSLPMPSPM